jgi:hypothetical protein
MKKYGIPKIPNDFALFIALNELNKTNKLRADLNRIDRDGGKFLDPFIDELKERIREYKK